VRHTYDFGEVLIDMWVVKRYSGEPSGLDDQALRWVTQEELETVELLPADGPIVAALRLPEKLTRAATAFYAVEELGGPDAGGRLRGVWCEGMADAMAGGDAGADFLVMRDELVHAEIASLCELVVVPVYVKGLGMEEAWNFGATGVVDLGNKT
jgi:hypothetical protein